MKPNLNPPFSLRLSEKMMNDIEKLASGNGITVTSQIRVLLAKGLNYAGTPHVKRKLKVN